MGKQHHVLHGDEFLGHMRLILINIQACGKDNAVPKRIDQGRLIDDASARDVDQYPLRAQCLQDIAINQTLGFGATGSSNDQEIRRFGKTDQIPVIRISHIRLPVATMIGNRDIEPFKPFGDCLANPSQSNDPDTPSAQCGR